MLDTLFPDYPDEREVQIMMKSSAYWPTNKTQRELALRQAYVGARAAAAAWESLTGWEPFLAKRDSDGNLLSETRYFEGDDHNGDLNLKGGLLRLDGIYIAGQLQTTDYEPYLYPYNALAKGECYTHIRGNFYGGYAGWGAGISSGVPRFGVKGVWGRALGVPADVYQGLQQVGGKFVIQQIQNLQSTGSISKDGFSKSLDITGVLTQQNLSELWGKDFNTIAAKNTRVIC